MAPSQSIKLTERHNPSTLARLLAHKGLEDDQKAQLRAYRKAAKSGNVTVSYTYTADWRKVQKGRVYGKGACYQYMKKDVRNLLARDYYVDVDMVNSQPTLLAHFAATHGWKVDRLQEYVDHRDAKMEELQQHYHCDRDGAKEIMLKLMYLGGLPKPSNAFLNEFKAELLQIATNCSLMFPAEYKQILAKTGDDKNPLSSMLSLVLLTEEHKVLMVMQRFLEAQGCTIGSLMYDGMLVSTAGYNSDMLAACEQAITQETGYVIKLAEKPMTSQLVLPDQAEEDINAIIDDDFAAKRFVDLVGRDKVVSVKGGYMVFDDRTGMWKDDDRLLRRLAHNHKADLIFEKETDDGKFTTVNYGGDNVRIARMIQSISNHVEEEDSFWENRLDTSVGYLLFEDGIYSFKTDSFTKGFDPALVFGARIPRPFNAKPDPDKVARVRKLMWEDPFTAEQIEEGVPLFDQINLAAALAGDYKRKKFFFRVGASDCGKGFLTNAAIDSCGGYCGTFNAKALVMQPRSANDTAKALSWVKFLRTLRVVFGNEIPNSDAFCGNMLKAFISGGDPMVVRSNGVDEEMMRNRATAFLYCNDIPKINPCDKGVQNRNGGVVEMHKSFKEFPDLSKGEMQMDTGLSGLFKQPEYQDAFVRVLLDAYQSYKAAGYTNPPPPCVEDASEEWLTKENSIMEMLREEFEITHDDRDFVAFDVIKNFIVGFKKLSISDKLLGKELTSLGFEKDTVKIRGKAKVVRLGLARIEPEDMM